MIFKTKINSIKISAFLAFCVLFAAGCKVQENVSDFLMIPVEAEKTESEADDPKAWTVIVYMAADNGLESSAISDFNEMEEADIPSNVNVLVLFDRIAGYDSSNGNWSSTRLYEISKDTDESRNQTLITSQQIPCEELGLSLEDETELDMGNKAVLSGLLSFARRNYEAEHYGLIIWGHGNGWRSFTTDETNSSSISLPELREAVETGMGLESETAETSEKKLLDFIGFDTCFSATAEVALELSGCAEVMAGTQGLEPDSGWNYTALFNSFGNSSFSAENFAEAAQAQFASQYSNYSYGSFCCLKLDKVPAFTAAFNGLCKAAADSIQSSEKRNYVFAALTESDKGYMFSTFPSDFYADTSEIENYIKENAADIDSGLFEDFEKKFSDAVFSSWCAGSCSGSDSAAETPDKEKGLAVFFAQYKSRGMFSLSHPALYVNGSRESDCCRFVSECSGWVPTSSNSGSLLDKLFYTEY